jgi:hypothetical protein
MLMDRNRRKDWKLLALDNEFGRQALSNRVISLNLGMEGVTGETVRQELNGESVQRSDLSRIRIRNGRGPTRLIIECNNASSFSGTDANWSVQCVKR